MRGRLAFDRVAMLMSLATTVSCSERDCFKLLNTCGLERVSTSETSGIDETSEPTSGTDETQTTAGTQAETTVE